MKDYVRIFNKLYYPQHDLKKFKKSVLNRELEAAMGYGKVLAMQELLKVLGDSPDMTIAEAVGEVQIKLKEAHDHVRTKLTLKIPALDFDKIMPPEFQEQEVEGKNTTKVGCALPQVFFDAEGRN